MRADGCKGKTKHIWIGNVLHKILGTGLSYFVYDNFGGEEKYKILKYLEKEIKIKNFKEILQKT